LKLALAVMLALIALGGIGSAAASERIRGIWVDAEKGTRFDILDGFQPNRGAILVVENDQETKLGSWTFEDGQFELKIGFQSGTAELLDDGRMNWNRSVFSRQETIRNTAVVSLKADEAGFIQKLIGTNWLTTKDGTNAIFRTTFSNDSGVFEIYKPGGALETLGAWGVSSNVLKIGSDTIVEARASDQYIIGLSDRDKFVVFRAIEKLATVETTKMDEQREAFLDALVTDAWYSVNYTSVKIHRFRPVEGDLKGRYLVTSEGLLTSHSVWEYSPSTGAMKLGYTTYVGGILVGNTLVFIEKDGDQKFLKRVADGPGKKYTVADVTTTVLSETQSDKVQTLLGGQFQYNEYTYTFEFAENGRNGFVHKFLSEPFSLTGQRFTNEVVGNRKTLHVVDDVVIFDEGTVLKRDSREIRLRPKTDAEAAADQVKSEEALKTALRQNVVIRIRGVDGNLMDFNVPLENLSQIADIQILVE
jgi:hypothetical protein